MAWALFAWITHNVDYDVEGLRDNTYKYVSPDSVLKSGKAKCGGYANLFGALCSHTKVKWLELVGKSKSAQEGFSDLGHAWNAIQIDGKW
jgi:transglutaminase/protease-like cytokinesis protein 3